MNRGTFPDEERKQWVAKCPKCGEEFLRHKGGAQCQLGKCSDLDLQNEHEEVLPLMVACALPNYKGNINASVPKDWHWKENKGLAGQSSAFSTPPWIKIPWYTCRIKGKFFDTVCHEAGHVSSIHAETEKGTVWFNSTTRKKIRKFVKMPWEENNPKYQSSINYIKKEWKRTEEGHEETAWQNEYVRIHGTLMGSQFAWYNYKKTQPQKYPSSVFWQGF
jgi:hypothetical protein